MGKIGHMCIDKTILVIKRPCQVLYVNCCLGLLIHWSFVNVIDTRYFGSTRQKWAQRLPCPYECVIIIKLTCFLRQNLNGCRHKFYTIMLSISFCITRAWVWYNCDNFSKVRLYLHGLYFPRNPHSFKWFDWRMTIIDKWANLARTVLQWISVTCMSMCIELWTHRYKVSGVVTDIFVMQDIWQKTCWKQIANNV